MNIVQISSPLYGDLQMRFSRLSIRITTREPADTMPGSRTWKTVVNEKIWRWRWTVTAPPFIRTATTSLSSANNMIYTLNDSKVPCILPLKFLSCTYINLRVYNCSTLYFSVLSIWILCIWLFFSVRPLWVRLRGENKPLSADQTYQLECEVVGARPPPTITWWKGSVAMKNSQDTVSNISSKYFSHSKHWNRTRFRGSKFPATSRLRSKNLISAAFPGKFASAKRATGINHCAETPT